MYLKDNAKIKDKAFLEVKEEIEDKAFLEVKAEMEDKAFLEVKAKIEDKAILEVKTEIKDKAFLNDKTVMITGATSGIGLATAVKMAGKGAIIIGTGRSKEKCAAAIEIIKKAHPLARVEYLEADLSSMSQVRQLAKAAGDVLEKSSVGRLDVLINNAGTVSSWYVSTEDGFELQFAVNHLAPFLLSQLMLPHLSKAGGKIITVSSGSHYGTKINWNDIMLRKHYGCLKAYKQTKLANVMFTAEFNRLHNEASGVRAYAVDPGLVNTDIGLKGTSGFVKWFWKKRANGGSSAEKPADCLAFLAGSISAGSISAGNISAGSISSSSISAGRVSSGSISAGSISADFSHEIYWKDSKPLQPSKYALDKEMNSRLWALSARMCGTAERK